MWLPIGLRAAVAWGAALAAGPRLGVHLSLRAPALLLAGVAYLLLRSLPPSAGVSWVLLVGVGAGAGIWLQVAVESWLRLILFALAELGLAVLIAGAFGQFLRRYALVLWLLALAGILLAALSALGWVRLPPAVAGATLAVALGVLAAVWSARLAGSPAARPPAAWGAELFLLGWALGLAFERLLSWHSRTP